jgi:hypothetical protein
MVTTNCQTAVSWSTWKEIGTVVTHRRHVRRTTAIALVVGSVFFTMNQLAAVLSGEATVVIWLKVALTYLTPFCMSNFGILTATRRPREDARSRSPADAAGIH